jgi:hypothetical protein
VRQSLAIDSPNVAQRLHLRNPGVLNFPPIGEVRIRLWLRELYPTEFSAIRYVGLDANDSLNLSEIRALLQTLLENHINQAWFRTSMFSPPVAESLALVLRNQRDRFLLDYYDGYNFDHPHIQGIHHLISLMKTSDTTVHGRCYSTKTPLSPLVLPTYQPMLIM